MNAAAKFIDVATVAFRGTTLRASTHGEELFPLLGNNRASGAALGRFAVEGLGYGCRTSGFAEGQHFDLEDPGFIGDTKTIAAANIA